MKVRTMTLGCALIVAMFAGVAWAEPGETTSESAVLMPEVEASKGADEEQRLDAETEAVATDAESGRVWRKDTGNQNQINCSCECTCPASGAFEVQFFSLPLWSHRNCQSFNGDGCSISTPDTCNTPRRYANCTQI